jgi:hypothetical protein
VGRFAARTVVPSRPTRYRVVVLTHTRLVVLLICVSIPFKSNDDVARLKGWTPIDAVVHEGRPGLWWMDMRDINLSEPFLEQTISQARKSLSPPREKFTEFDAVIQLEETLDSVSPSGFIFHASRCGSTLVANACRALSGSIVLSEPAAVDKLVARFSTDANTPVKEALYSVVLRGVVKALSQRRHGDESRLFLKFSCCSVAQLRRIRRIWPNVPWLFIYRDPAEIIVSNLRNVPTWLEDADNRVLADIIGLASTELAGMNREELCARSIGAFLGHASRLANDNGMLLNYSELSISSLLRVLEFFGITPSKAEFRQVENAASVYSKDRTGQRPYLSDISDKKQMTSAVVREVSDRWCADQYRKLEQTRLANTL